MEIQGLALRTRGGGTTDRAVYFCTLCGYTRTEAVVLDEE
ncbi:MAG: hypothetical protein OJF48_002515 [Afipia sp.]|jgi:hypothetical protein|nr:MAG: hypothetical protein OJF48_002515 [Afipia sp.]